MDRKNLVEIRKGEAGTGLLIEHDGYISIDCGENKKLFEDINSNTEDDFHCPRHFIVSAVFQKYGVENANGRIYPEHVLKREVERYMELVREKRAIGECYRPEAMVLTESGWKHLYEVSIGENILTLNPQTNKIEIKPILNIVRYHYNDKMINIKGRGIDDIVTPDHGFPIYDRNNKFKSFVTAKEILHSDNLSHYYIPKTGEWVGRYDEYMIIPKLKLEDFGKNISKSLKEKYLQDLIIPMDIFAKFMGIYLSEGSHSKKGSKNYKVNIHQKKEDVSIEIEKMLKEWDINFSVNTNNKNLKTFVISDMRLCKYLQEFGLCYDKHVPQILKEQSKEILKLFYDWFVMGDGRVRGDKRRGGKGNYSDDVFSTSKQLVLDLNEIQLKIGYFGNLLKEDRNSDRIIEGRTIKGENSAPMYFSYRGLVKGVYLDKRFLTAEEVDYNGDVMCVEVENHIWYVMDNGKCHWTKNCNHPSESVIDLSRVAMNIIELHWEGRTLVGKLELLTSHGFRKYGIISNQADQVANLLLSGIKIGVSSRGLGTVTNKMGVLYVSDDYEIVCWDVVSTPSTPGSWIMPTDEGLQPYVESKVEDSSKPKLFEDLEKFNDWLND